MMNEVFHENLSVEIPASTRNGVSGMKVIDKKLTTSDYRVGSLITVIVLAVFVIGIRFI